MSYHPILALTPREKEIATLIRDGLTNKEIAQKTWISSRTVESMIRNILRKLQAKNRTQLMLIINGNLKTDAEIVLSATNIKILFRAEVRRLKNLGCSSLKIAQTLNASSQRINGVLKRLGYPIKSKDNAKFRREKIMKMSQSGYSVKQITKEVKLTPCRVYAILREVKACAHS